VRFGMHKKGPELRFCSSGPKFPVPPAGFEPAHTASEGVVFRAISQFSVVADTPSGSPYRKWPTG
jgi:hypothetical protein